MNWQTQVPLACIVNVDSIASGVWFKLTRHDGLVASIAQDLWQGSNALQVSPSTARLGVDLHQHDNSPDSACPHIQGGPGRMVHG